MEIEIIKAAGQRISDVSSRVEYCHIEGDTENAFAAIFAYKYSTTVRKTLCNAPATTCNMGNFVSY